MEKTAMERTVMRRYRFVYFVCLFLPSGGIEKQESENDRRRTRGGWGNGEVKGGGR